MLGDCHIHMALDGADYKKALGMHREGVREDWIRAQLQAYADAGVTFLRDGGDKLGVCERAAILAGEYGIDYRTPVFPICKKGRYGGFIGRTFEDFPEYRALVREAKARGAHFIKIMISGLMDFDRFGQITSIPLSRAEIGDMIAFAHDQGLSVMAHANGADTIRNALDAGVDSIEHGAYMDAECVLQLSESGAVWTPTLATIANLIGCERYPDAVLKPLLRFQSDNVRACHRQGGFIAVGSDAGAYRVPHVQGLRDEIALLTALVGGEAPLQSGEDRIRSVFQPK